MFGMLSTKQLDQAMSSVFTEQEREQMNLRGKKDPSKKISTQIVQTTLDGVTRSFNARMMSGHMGEQSREQAESVQHTTTTKEGTSKTSFAEIDQRYGATESAAPSKQASSDGPSFG